MSYQFPRDARGVREHYLQAERTGQLAPDADGVFCDAVPLNGYDAATRYRARRRLAIAQQSHLSMRDLYERYEDRQRAVRQDRDDERRR